jgi:hypothetical protein
MLREANYYSRMAYGLWQYMRTPPLPDPEAVIRDGLLNREANLLSLVRDCILVNPANPITAMLHLAGCEFGDLETMVRRDGLETTLTTLYENGVYLAHDEFKGRAPIVRSGREIPYDLSGCQNPTVKGYLESTSSGSRSEGMRSRRNIARTLYREAWERIVKSEFDPDRSRTWISLAPILPSAYGVTGAVNAARGGRPLDSWFANGGSLKDSAHYRAVTRFLLAEARLAGYRVPFPQYVPRNDYGPVAERVAERQAQGRPAVVQGSVTSCVRTAAAALDGGLDISGSTFLVGGEALTDAKREILARAGASVSPSYYISEVGFVGRACRNITAGNCVHINKDMVAVIRRRRTAPLTDIELDSLLFTPLPTFSSFALLNVEMDDAGTLGERTCDCVFGRLGMTGEISGIYSYGKLTGQGTTLIGSDVLLILEEALPRRFGGAPGDYQLVEEDRGDQTQLSLRVSPRIGLQSEEEVRSFFLSEIKKVFGGAPARREWMQTDGVAVYFEEPMTTATGKVLPLDLLGFGRRDNAA